MKGKGLLLWIAAGSGIVLLYAAYKDENPLTILNRYNGVTGPTPPSTPITTPPANTNRSFDRNGHPTPTPNAYSNTPTPHVPGTPY